MDILIDETLDGKTVKEVLTNTLGYSANMIKKLKFSENGILVNGSFVTVRHTLEIGERLSLSVEDKSEDVSPYTIPVNIPIEIIFEDEHVTAVNKPSDMPSHPSLGHKNDTVANALAYRYREKNYVFRPVNRLDRDTSGCMLTANSKAASYKMYRAMTEGKIHKTYIAVTDGSPAAKSGELRSYLRRTHNSIIMREETDESDPEGKLAVTKYRVLAEDRGHALILLSPITGRTHQLRVQLSGIGCPITGDDLYGKSSPNISRQALHAIKTEFPHPQSGEIIKLTAPLSDDISALTEKYFSKESLEGSFKARLYTESI